MIRRGPALIEVVIALVILGMLAVVLFPTWAAARERRNATACAGNMQQIYRAFGLYQADWDAQLPAHTPTWTWDSGQHGYTWPELARYGLGIGNCRCPNRDLQDTVGGYDFRLDLRLPFEDHWLGNHPIDEEHSLSRTIVAAPESVLVVCNAHIRHDNALRQQSSVGNYQILRANGRIERVPAAQVSWWGYGNGRWYPDGSYPGGSPMPNSVQYFLTFPREPWPPRFKP